MKKRFKRIYIEITNICNKNCKFCSPLLRSLKFMSVDEFEYILKEIKDYTDYIYLHVKGEPLLHPNLDKILELCEIYNIKVNITTNGTLLLEKTDILLKYDCVRQINVSLHSFAENDSENYIINILIATKKILTTSPIYVNYRFWALENGKLTKDMKTMIKVIINYFDLSNELLLEIININNIKLKENLFLNKAELFEWPSLNNKFISKYGTCNGTKDHIAILCDGTIVPCCLDSDGIIDLGNIYNIGFKNILNNKFFIDFNNNLKNNFLQKELCQKCSYRKRFDK